MITEEAPAATLIPFTVLLLLPLVMTAGPFTLCKRAPGHVPDGDGIAASYVYATQRKNDDGHLQRSGYRPVRRSERRWPGPS
ncbi:hypothetical protein [Streptomyces griseomycini]|uniref:Uncharacterized protein n=1 Tax=Streptomyces griseomycini TaxID=66895 RepID=A0A7W7VB71_9ACTN|nr:hypothetical protein [Streptomyces griseomycini]MBB4903704.1 hypothetical protein [Streptomyces griseomycini]GGR61587.1 hypothetical protein GCM10015536_76860 [Streptomyces griseomycini]